MARELILVVDDNRQIADFIAGSLLPSLNYQALVANDGLTAMRLVKQRHKDIDLMLLDLNLPDTSGLELLRRMVDKGYHVPTVLFTAHGSESVAVDAFRLGVQDYLKKPIKVNELSATINEALSISRLKKEKGHLNNQLQQRVTWLTTLTQVGRSLTSTLDAEEVLKRIVDAGVMLSRAEQGFLALVDKESNELLLRVVKNIDEDKINTLRLPVHDPLMGKVFNTGRPLRLVQQPGGNRLKVSTGMLVMSLLHVPIRAKGVTIGVISVNNHSSMRPFTETDEMLLISLGDYAAIAIENAQLYQQARGEIQERKRIEGALRESQERYALAVSGANDGIWDWDLRTNRIFYSGRWKDMIGFNNQEISGHPDEWFRRIHPEDLDNTKRKISAHINRRTSHFVDEHRMLHKDGKYRWVLVRGHAVRDPKSGHVVRMAGSQSDITDRKAIEAQLIHDAFHDSLTGLPNRSLLIDRLTRAIDRAQRDPNFKFAVLFLDLDNFKNINDTLGHLVGDQLLVAVGDILSQGLRGTDTLARFGGDEFVILLEGLRSEKSVTRMTDWIRRQFEAHIQIGDNRIFTTTSIGIVIFNNEHEAAEEMLRDADIAMYVAKSKGRDRAEFFESSMRTRVFQRIYLEAELRQALVNGELEIYYQPIISMQDHQLIGLEAFLRWMHPVRGVLRPGTFLEMAEETGIVIDIDHWVIREACHQIVHWQEMYQGDSDLFVNVNISGKHLTKQDFPHFIRQVLAESGLPGDRLNIEIPERRFVIHDNETTDVFNILSEMGVDFLVDDFSLGYATLSQISGMPVTSLKIDAGFVSSMFEDEKQLEILRKIIELTLSWGLHIMAEGIETEEQMQQLVDLGCEFGQGELICGPLVRDQVDNWLEEYQSTGTFAAHTPEEIPGDESLPEELPAEEEISPQETPSEETWIEDDSMEENPSEE